jgi:hypothetical protein
MNAALASTANVGCVSAAGRRAGYLSAAEADAALFLDTDNCG